MSLTGRVVLAVSTLGILSVCGVIALAIVQHPIPDLLQNVAIGSLTGLVGLLVPTSGEPQGNGDSPADADAP